FLRANARRPQIGGIKYGPDGNVFMIAWYDKNQCHRRENEVHDRTNGRIFKIAYGDARAQPADLGKQDDAALVANLSQDNQWVVRHARRRLQERAMALPADARAKLAASLAEQAFGTAQDTPRLDHLLALHAVGGLDESRLARALADKSAAIRAWGIQLALDDRQASAESLAKFAELARSDS